MRSVVRLLQPSFFIRFLSPVGTKYSNLNKYFAPTELDRFFLFVSHLRQITQRRPQIQLIQQRVVAPTLLQLGHATLHVSQIAEDDRVSGTTLCARRLNLAVIDSPVFVTRRHLYFLTPFPSETPLRHRPQ